MKHTNLLYGSLPIAMIVISLILPHLAFAAESDYGAGFWSSPSLEEDANATTSLRPQRISKLNYGAGYIPSPYLSDCSTPSYSISKHSYGAGYMSSPVFHHEGKDRQHTQTNHHKAYGAGYMEYSRIAWLY